MKARSSMTKPEGVETDEESPMGSEPAASEDERGAASVRRWLLVVIVFPVIGLLVGFAVDQRQHEGRVLRGVLIGGVDVGDLRVEEAKALLAPLEQRLLGVARVVTMRTARRELKAVDVGFTIDRESTVARAMALGRSAAWLDRFGWWLGRLLNPITIDPVGRVDPEKLRTMLTDWASEVIEDGPYEGAVIVEAGAAKSDPPRAGTVVAFELALSGLSLQLAQMTNKPWPVPLKKRAPRRDATRIDEATIRAQRWLSAAITLRVILPTEEAEDEGTKPKRRRKAKREVEGREVVLKLAPDVLAAALKSKLTEGKQPGVAIYFDPKIIDFALEEARRQIERPPQDARFILSRGEKISIVPSRPSRSLLAEKVALALQEAAETEERSGEIPVSPGAPPQLTTAEARALGIKGRVSKFTTVHPCCRNRVKNIHRIAGIVDSTLLKPGETFSLNERVGERRRRGGFLPAPTIVHGKIIDTVGGGISQFATTMFNAAFYGGYEIVERQPHTYYFRRYPMGHEATLSYPKPDLIIRNDTKAGLLIKCDYGPTYITVKMYGDNGGRKVKRKVARLKNIVEPPIVFEGDPTMDPEDEKVLERGQHGWSVVVSRVMTMPDGEKKEESRRVIYKARSRKLRVHPCMIPAEQEGHTGEKCPVEEEDEPAPSDANPDDAEVASEVPRREAGEPGADSKVSPTASSKSASAVSPGDPEPSGSEDDAE